jgi:hypothetical protein
MMRVSLTLSADLSSEQLLLIPSPKPLSPQVQSEFDLTRRTSNSCEVDFAFIQI